MNDKTRVIDLFGSADCILYKGPEHMVIRFKDDVSGEVVCTIPCNQLLYLHVNPKERYHLQVELQGTSRKNRNGTKSTRNNLIVKKARII